MLQVEFSPSEWSTFFKVIATAFKDMATIGSETRAHDDIRLKLICELVHSGIFPKFDQCESPKRIAINFLHIIMRSIFTCRNSTIRSMSGLLLEPLLSSVVWTRDYRGEEEEIVPTPQNQLCEYILSFFLPNAADFIENYLHASVASTCPVPSRFRSYPWQSEMLLERPRSVVMHAVDNTSRVLAPLFASFVKSFLSVSGGSHHVSTLLAVWTKREETSKTSGDVVHHLHCVSHLPLAISRMAYHARGAVVSALGAFLLLGDTSVLSGCMSRLAFDDFSREEAWGVKRGEDALSLMLHDSIETAMSDTARGITMLTEVRTLGVNLKGGRGGLRVVWDNTAANRRRLYLLRFGACQAVCELLKAVPSSEALLVFKEAAVKHGIVEGLPSYLTILNNKKSSLLDAYEDNDDFWEDDENGDATEDQDRVQQKRLLKLILNMQCRILLSSAAAKVITSAQSMGDTAELWVVLKQIVLGSVKLISASSSRLHQILLLDCQLSMAAILGTFRGAPEAANLQRGLFGIMHDDDLYEDEMETGALAAANVRTVLLQAMGMLGAAESTLLDPMNLAPATGGLVLHPRFLCELVETAALAANPRWIRENEGGVRNGPWTEAPAMLVAIYGLIRVGERDATWGVNQSCCKLHENGTPMSSKELSVASLLQLASLIEEMFFWNAKSIFTREGFMTGFGVSSRRHLLTNYLSAIQSADNIDRVHNKSNRLRALIKSVTTVRQLCAASAGYRLTILRNSAGEFARATEGVRRWAEALRDKKVDVANHWWNDYLTSKLNLTGVNAIGGASEGASLRLLPSLVREIAEQLVRETGVEKFLIICNQFRFGHQYSTALKAWEESVSQYVEKVVRVSHGDTAALNVLAVSKMLMSRLVLGGFALDCDWVRNLLDAISTNVLCELEEGLNTWRRLNGMETAQFLCELIITCPAAALPHLELIGKIMTSTSTLLTRLTKHSELPAALREHKAIEATRFTLCETFIALMDIAETAAKFAVESLRDHTLTLGKFNGLDDLSKLQAAAFQVEIGITRLAGQPPLADVSHRALRTIALLRELSQRLPVKLSTLTSASKMSGDPALSALARCFTALPQQIPPPLNYRPPSNYYSAPNALGMFAELMRLRRVDLSNAEECSMTERIAKFCMMALAGDSFKQTGRSQGDRDVRSQAVRTLKAILFHPRTPEPVRSSSLRALMSAANSPSLTLDKISRIEALPHPDILSTFTQLTSFKNPGFSQPVPSGVVPQRANLSDRSDLQTAALNALLAAFKKPRVQSACEPHVISLTPSAEEEAAVRTKLSSILYPLLSTFAELFAPPACSTEMDCADPLLSVQVCMHLDRAKTQPSCPQKPSRSALPLRVPANSCTPPVSVAVYPPRLFLMHAMLGNRSTFSEVRTKSYVPAFKRPADSSTDNQKVYSLHLESSKVIAEYWRSHTQTYYRAFIRHTVQSIVTPHMNNKQIPFAVSASLDILFATLLVAVAVSPSRYPSALTNGGESEVKFDALSEKCIQNIFEEVVTAVKEESANLHAASTCQGTTHAPSTNFLHSTLASCARSLSCSISSLQLQLTDDMVSLSTSLFAPHFVDMLPEEDEEDDTRTVKSIRMHMKTDSLIDPAVAITLGFPPTLQPDLDTIVRRVHLRLISVANLMASTISTLTHFEGHIRPPRVPSQILKKPDGDAANPPVSVPSNSRTPAEVLGTAAQVNHTQPSAPAEDIQSRSRLVRTRVSAIQTSRPSGTAGAVTALLNCTAESEEDDSDMGGALPFSIRKSSKMSGFRTGNLVSSIMQDEDDESMNETPIPDSSANRRRFAVANKPHQSVSTPSQGDSRGKKPKLISNFDVDTL